jgi:hypothetical protein
MNKEPIRKSLVYKWLEISKDWSFAKLNKELHKSYERGFLDVQEAQVIMKNFQGS